MRLMNDFIGCKMVETAYDISSWRSLDYFHIKVEVGGLSFDVPSTRNGLPLRCRSRFELGVARNSWSGMRSCLIPHVICMRTADFERAWCVSKGSGWSAMSHVESLRKRLRVIVHLCSIASHLEQ